MYAKIRRNKHPNVQRATKFMVSFIRYQFIPNEPFFSEDQVEEVIS